MKRTALLLGLLTVLVGSLLAGSARAQERATRYGVGVDLLLGPPENDATTDGFGIGVRTRASIPLTYEVSLGLGAGVSGSLYRGRREASYTFNPQASLIVTFPREEQGDWWPYVLAGGGGFVSLRGEAPGGPSIHGGIGWTRLLQDASIYVEFDPSLVIMKEDSAGLFSLRGGVIF